MPNPKGYNQYKRKGSAAPKKSTGTNMVQNFAGGSIHKSDAAAKMFGVGSAQHKAALKRFGKP